MSVDGQIRRLTVNQCRLTVKDGGQICRLTVYFWPVESSLRRTQNGTQKDFAFVSIQSNPIQSNPIHSIPIQPIKPIPIQSQPKPIKSHPIPIQANQIPSNPEMANEVVVLHDGGGKKKLTHPTPAPINLHKKPTNHALARA